MKKKTAVILISMISTLIPPSVMAQDDAVRRAEAELRTFEQKFGKDNKDYYRRLLVLAAVYQENSMRDEADRTFHRALDAADGLGASKIAEVMNYWAGVLRRPRRHYSFPRGTAPADQQKFILADRREHEKDLVLAERILEDSRNLSTGLPKDDPNKFEASLSLVRRYRSEGKLREADALQREVRNQILDDATRTRDPASLMRLSRIVDRLAGEYGSDLKDTNAINTACSLKFDALSVVDRLPANSAQRITAHRSAVAWFRSVGRDSFANSETRVLSKLLNTTNQNVLFPPHRPCLACGRG
ncbi:MAG: hypothetical protein AB7W16_13055 [Candidatus Obscuribacterales bacterium]